RRRFRPASRGTDRSRVERRAEPFDPLEDEESGADSAPSGGTPARSVTTRRGGFTGRRPGTVRRRRRRWSTRAVDCARSATRRSVASYRRTKAGASASSPAAASTARSTEVGTLTPPVTYKRQPAGPTTPGYRVPST